MTVQLHILYSVLIRRRIDLDTRHGFRSSHRRQDRKYTGAGTHVYYALPVKVHFKQLFRNQRRRRMMSCPESHLRIYHNVIFTGRNIPMK